MGLGYALRHEGVDHSSESGAHHHRRGNLSGHGWVENACIATRRPVWMCGRFQRRGDMGYGVGNVELAEI